jgi:Fic family protein
MDLNQWLDYFVETTMFAQAITKLKIDFTLGKARFYDAFADQLNKRQAKVVTRIFAEGIKELEGGLTNKKYRVITRCSATTATRDITHLLHIGALNQRKGGGRSTHYTLATIDQTLLSRWQSTQKTELIEKTNPQH